MKRLLILLLICLLPLTQTSTTAHAHFDDVTEHYRFYDEIQYLIMRGVLKPDGTLHVSSHVSRQEFALLIGKTLQLDATLKPTIFHDVPATAFYSGYIQSAVDAGIISGYPDGTFRPHQSISRGEIAILLQRAFKLKGNATVPFKDVAPHTKAYPAIQALVALNITKGYPDGTFRPTNTLERGQLLAFIALADMYFKKTQWLLIEDGRYVVGQQMKRGEYVIMPSSSTQPAHVQLTREDGTIIYDERVNTHDFLTVQRGQTIQIDNGRLLLAKYVPRLFITDRTEIEAGTYRIPQDLQEGTYQLTPIFEQREASYTIRSSTDYTTEAAPATSFRQPTTITVRNGEYVIIRHARLTPLHSP